MGSSLTVWLLLVVSTVVRHVQLGVLVLLVDEGGATSTFLRRLILINFVIDLMVVGAS